MKYQIDKNGNLRTADRLLDGATEITAEEYAERLVYIRENAVHIIDDTPVEEELTAEEALEIILGGEV